MSVFMRLISLVLIVSALMLLGADAVTSLERGGEVTVRSVAQIWALFNKAGMEGFKAWTQHNLPAFLAQGVFSFLAVPGWSVTGVLGVILAFVFGRKLEE
jgi:cytochrome bd-type quinol oxidase subunit 2